MSDVAAIDGITGPGRRTTLIQGDIQEITFRLKKKVIEIVNRDGSMGQYDLAQVSSVQVNSEGTDYTLAIVSRETKESPDARSQSETDGREDLIDYWTDTIAEASGRTDAERKAIATGQTYRKPGDEKQPGEDRKPGAGTIANKKP